MLEMKTQCLVCDTTLRQDSDAMICSYECTYCVTCANDRNLECKNCTGELVAGPKREGNS